MRRLLLARPAREGFIFGRVFWFLGGKEEFLRFVFMIPVIDALDCRYGIWVWDRGSPEN
jgi:hypothetical protein